MRTLFTFMCCMAFFVSASYAQSTNTAVKTKAKAEFNQTNKKELKASDATPKASTFTKDNLRAKQQSQPATKDLNNEINAVNREIEAVKTKLNSSDKSQNSKAQKAKLEKLEAEKHELKVKTL